MKYAWIETQRSAFLLSVVCDALSVSQSGFRAWQAGGTPARKGLRRAGLGADPHGPSGGPTGIRRLAHSRGAAWVGLAGWFATHRASDA